MQCGRWTVPSHPCFHVCPLCGLSCCLGLLRCCQLQATLCAGASPGPPLTTIRDSAAQVPTSAAGHCGLDIAVADLRVAACEPHGGASVAACAGGEPTGCRWRSASYCLCHDRCHLVALPRALDCAVPCLAGWTRVACPFLPPSVFLVPCLRWPLGATCWRLGQPSVAALVLPASVGMEASMPPSNPRFGPPLVPTLPLDAGCRVRPASRRRPGSFGHDCWFAGLAPSYGAACGLALGASTWRACSAHLHCLLQAVAVSPAPCLAAASQ